MKIRKIVFFKIELLSVGNGSGSIGGEQEISHSNSRTYSHLTLLLNASGLPAKTKSDKFNTLLTRFNRNFESRPPISIQK